MVNAAGATNSLERWFHISERGSTPRREVLGGLATFLTMSYIVFVNPAILSAAGLPFTAVAIATALAAAIFTAAMGLFANFPLALAPGLGLNAVVAFDIIIGRGVSWQVGMACVVIEGLIALVLVLVGLREAVVNAVPMSLKLAIGVGIGLFITLIGLREGGIVVNNPATGIGLGDLADEVPLTAFAGIIVAIVLVARSFRGALLVGIAASTIVGLLLGVLDTPDSIFDVPGSNDFSTIGDALDPSNLRDALTLALIPIIFALFMSDFFDTIGTAVAVGRTGDLLDDQGRIPNVRNVLLVDSAAAAGGGVMGTSSVTSYIESGAGVSEGARTGLASLVTAGLFGLTIFALPLITLVGQSVEISEGVFIHPAIAAPLVLVGYFMLKLVADIEWESPENAIPAFLVIVGIPMTFSIAAGIGFGVIGYALVMSARGRMRDVTPLMWALVVMFLVFFASDWLSAEVF